MSTGDRLPRVVLDCMIFLQGAARETSPAGACLKLVENGFIELCLSPEVVAEIREVLNRPKLQRTFPALTPNSVEMLLQELLSAATFVAEVSKQFLHVRDPKDEKYLTLAIQAEAQYLVSRDRDLLDLMDEKRPDGKEFGRKFPDLTILDPAAFLRELSSEQQE